MMDNSKRQTRRERVYHQLVEMTQQITLKRINDADFDEFDASGIGKHLNITMNNTCMELNALVKEGALVKILGRPVYFFSKKDLEQITGVSLQRCIWENFPQFKEAVNGAKEQTRLREAAGAPKEMPPSAIPFGSSFAGFVGVEQSLRKCINQAKAAILYPPNGLHTLITGETGTGKSHFAEAMYDFAAEANCISKSSKFVIYNCASYSENPQLLLSQLFGYKKGAFTGADRDSLGVIDQANGGILFLDEAHRLSAEGQEKMFLLIDKGIFQRLGEKEDYHRANLRIIAATTEDPQKVLLSTFMRRIAVVIHIPPLEKRSFDERVRFVFRFLWNEAKNIERQLYVNSEVIKALVMYKCPGNVGQIWGDIRCMCANAFLDFCAFGSAQPNQNRVTVELVHLPDTVENGLYGASSSNAALFQRYEFYYHEYIPIDGSGKDCEKLAEFRIL